MKPSLPADPFAIVELPQAVPEGAAHADLAAEWTRQFLRRSELEDQLDEERRRNTLATKRLLLDMLQVADRLEALLARPVAAASDASTDRLRRGIEAAHRLLLKQLADAGVVPVDLQGRIADPEVADVEGTQADPELPEETVVTEIVRAYRWKEQTLRRAKVIVTVRSEDD